MENKSTRFYDLRFGVLLAIIIMILVFKYYNGRTPEAVPLRAGTAAPSDHQLPSSPSTAPAAGARATAR